MKQETTTEGDTLLVYITREDGRVDKERWPIKGWNKSKGPITDMPADEWQAINCWYCVEICRSGLPPFWHGWGFNLDTNRRSYHEEPWDENSLAAVEKRFRNWLKDTRPHGEPH